MLVRWCTSGTLALALAGALRGQSPAALVGQKYEVDPMHSSVGFTSRVLRVVKVPGRFLEYAGTILYDPLRPEQSSVTAIISAKSLTTDMEFRDNHLRSPDFFDTGHFPLIVFQSDSVRRQGTGLLVAGRFTLHGITRPVTLPVTIVLPPDTVNPASGIVTVAFEATLKLSRKDFDIAGTNKFNPDFDPATNLVADSFDVTLEMDAQHEGYRNRRFDAGPPPSVGDTVLRTIETGGIERGKALYNSLHASQPKTFNFSAGQLDLVGHLLIERGQLRDAVAIFQLNAQVYPKNVGVLDALGEAQCLAGDRSGALLTFQQAAQLDSTDTTPVEMIRRLRALK